MSKTNPTRSSGVTPEAIVRSSSRLICSRIVAQDSCLISTWVIRLQEVLSQTYLLRAVPMARGCSISTRDGTSQNLHFSLYSHVSIRLISMAWRLLPLQDSIYDVFRHAATPSLATTHQSSPET